MGPSPHSAPSKISFGSPKLLHKETRSPPTPPKRNPWLNNHPPSSPSTGPVRSFALQNPTKSHPGRSRKSHTKILSQADSQTPTAGQIRNHHQNGPATRSARPQKGTADSKILSNSQLN
jgi:hypothetical protein